MVAGEDENEADRGKLPNSKLYASSSYAASLHTHRPYAPVNPNEPPLFSHSLDDDFLIFPPINHENLHIFSPCTQNDQTPQPESTPTTTTSVSSDERLRPVDGVGRWFRSGLEILSSKILNFGLLFQSWASNRRTFRSFDAAAVFSSALLVMFVCSVLRQRWRLRRVRRRSEDRLMRLIEEKDERIIELLHQITQMSQALLDRQRVVVPGSS